MSLYCDVQGPVLHNVTIHEIGNLGLILWSTPQIHGRVNVLNNVKHYFTFWKQQMQTMFYKTWSKCNVLILSGYQTIFLTTWSLSISNLVFTNKRTESDVQWHIRIHLRNLYSLHMTRLEEIRSWGLKHYISTT